MSDTPGAGKGVGQRDANSGFSRVSGSAKRFGYNSSSRCSRTEYSSSAMLSGP
jgi:hypothetical protein